MPHKVIKITQLGTASLAASAVITFKNLDTDHLHTERLTGYVIGGHPNMGYRRVMPKNSNGWELLSVESSGPISVTFEEVSDVA